MVPLSPIKIFAIPKYPLVTSPPPLPPTSSSPPSSTLLSPMVSPLRVEDGRHVRKHREISINFEKISNFIRETTNKRGKKRK
jgi:hypothetical protein